MGGYNFDFSGDGTNPQADDGETATISETGTTSVALPHSIKITDVVLAATATNKHQYRFFVNGKSQGFNFFSAQINPATDGRVTWADQGIVIPKGATLQMKGSQKAATTAEATTVLVKYDSLGD